MGLLADFEGKKKRPFQRYTVHHGIEQFEVLVPLENAATFEAKIAKLQDKSKSHILEVLQQSGGRKI